MNNVNSIKAVQDIIYDTLLENVALNIKIKALSRHIKPFTSKYAVKKIEEVIYKNRYVR